MNALTLLPASQHRRMPWRNGLGNTLEIARDTPGTGEGWGWRVSLADVAHSGPFSPFAGMARIISVIEGAGMQLNVGGTLSPALGCREAFAFSGDAQVHCQLVDGPIRDFNLIYCPSTYQAHLKWLRVESRLWLEQPHTSILFCATGALSIERKPETLTAGTLDAVIVEAGAAGAGFYLAGDAQVCVVTLQPAIPAL